ncbi:MAG: hypothetical protein KBD46_00585 [Candidatus Levybacteria bacterium]|nr:hypothetical protein [Candidatus Levybacteria bacterium]
MNAIDLLRLQFKSAHDTQEATMADVLAPVAHFTEVGKALPIGAAYAHSVISEDVILSSMVRQRTPLSSMHANTGLSQPMPSFSEWEKHEQWAKTVKIDLEQFRVFAKEIYAETDAYLATLEEEDLDREIDLGAFGKHTLAFVLTNFFLLHIANLTGEISAAKGIQGLKGYPF